MNGPRVQVRIFLGFVLLASSLLALPARAAVVSVGSEHACAVVNGAAKCWGRNNYGQLGNGGNANSSIPVQVVGLTSGVTAISAGYNHTCAIVNGAALCWGRNFNGQLGDGTFNNANSPVQVTGQTSGVTAIAGGEEHTCFIRNGAAGCMGWGFYGQLGRGSQTASNTPVQVGNSALGSPELLSGVTAIAAGRNFACAVVNAGLKCWGQNTDGELGDGSTNTSLVPVQVSGLASLVTDVEAGNAHTCALVNGGVRCWGFNQNGQLGDGTVSPRLTPVGVSGLSSGVTLIAAGGFHTCASVGGDTRCWGHNQSRQLGDGTIADYSAVPSPVVRLGAGVTALGAGYDSSCAMVGGGVVCWGLNDFGQVGNNSTTLAPLPAVAIAGPNATLTVSRAGTGSGVVTSSPAGVSCSPTCAPAFTYGTPVTLSATEAAGSAFTGWSGGGCSGVGVCTVGMYTASSVTATFNIDPNPPRMGNISTRMQVQTGNDVMIGGFVIGGSANKRVAIVATGPSLSAFGIANPLANPSITLVRSSDQVVMATNDDWQSAANAAQLTAAGFAPSNALEAAILIDLAPGAYTAIVQGVGGGTGVSVIGVYEVDHSEIPLINISTRGRVLTGNDVMIGGFVVTGSGPKAVAIVATGPSLAAFGITQPLANPSITLVRSSDQTVIDSNDDWQAHASALQLQAAGFAPTNPLESGLVTTLQPGAYTVVVQGVGGGTGVAVIGVYKLN